MKLVIVSVIVSSLACNGSSPTTDGGLDAGDAADDVVHCTYVALDSGYCYTTDSCGNQVPLPPDGAVVAVDTCGYDCSCTIDAGFETISCVAQQCTCPHQCTP